MKRKKLKLSRKTVRVLSDASSANVAGAATDQNTVCQCFTITACYFCQPPPTVGCPPVPPPPSIFDPKCFP